MGGGGGGGICLECDLGIVCVNGCNMRDNSGGSRPCDAQTQQLFRLRLAENKVKHTIRTVMYVWNHPNPDLTTPLEDTASAFPPPLYSSTAAYLLKDISGFILVLYEFPRSPQFSQLE